MAKPKNTTLMSSLKEDLNDLDISKQSKYYEIVRDLIQDIGNADKKRAKVLKNIGDSMVKAAKNAEKIGESTFETLDYTDQLIEAHKKNNKADIDRLNIAQKIADTTNRQNTILEKQAKIAGDLGRKISGIFDNIPGGGLLAAMLGVDTLGEDIERAVKINFAGGAGGRGLGQEIGGSLIGAQLGRAGQGGTTDDDGEFKPGLANPLEQRGNISKFVRSISTTQIAVAGGVAVALMAATKNIRAGMEKGMGFSGTGRGFLQNMFLGDTADAFESEFGKVNSISTSTATQFRIMAKTMGLTAENAASLSKELVISSDLTQEQSVDVLKTVQGLSMAAGVAPKEIFQDMAQNSDLFAQFAQDGAGGLAQAAIKAKTLGLNLGAVSSVASSLLDFETSISNEFEAQVLTGKMINLDRARGLALQGKASELLDEIVSQVGGEAELRSMNILQMQSLAGAVGLSVAQLQRVVQGNEASLKNPVVSKLDETNEILRAQLDTEQRQLLGQQKQDTLVTYG
jgi:hypothetical protein